MTIVLAIKSSDNYLHVGEAEELLAHYGVGTAAEDTGLANLEFYNPGGARLDIDRSGAQPAFVPAAGPATDLPEVLAARVGVVLARARVALAREPDDQIGRIPLIDATLPLLVAAVVAWNGPLLKKNEPTPSDRGDRFHNLLHSAGLA